MSSTSEEFIQLGNSQINLNDKLSYYESAARFQSEEGWKLVKSLFFVKDYTVERFLLLKPSPERWYEFGMLFTGEFDVDHPMRVEFMRQSANNGYQPAADYLRELYKGVDGHKATMWNNIWQVMEKNRKLEEMKQ